MAAWTPAKFASAIDALAESQGVSKSALLREALVERALHPAPVSRSSKEVGDG